MTDDFDNRPDYPPIDPTEDSACRALWMSAALQGLADAIGTNSRCGGKLAQAEALRWLNSPAAARDFEMVCHLADLDPTKLRKRFHEMIRNSKSPDFRCNKMAKQKNREMESRRKYLGRSRRNAILREVRQHDAKAANDNFSNQPEKEKKQ